MESQRHDLSNDLACVALPPSQSVGWGRRVAHGGHRETLTRHKEEKITGAPADENFDLY